MLQDLGMPHLAKRGHSLKKKSIRDEIVQPANSSENFSADMSKLASQMVIWLSLTGILTSRYFPGYSFILNTRDSDKDHDKTQYLSSLTSLVTYP